MNTKTEIWGCYLGHELVEWNDEEGRGPKDRLNAWMEDEITYSAEMRNLWC